MNIWQHFKTITDHRMRVMRRCFKVGLYRQGLAHDLSKYSWTEFSEGCRFYQGNRSPNNRAKEVQGVSQAWLHHKGRNKHHFEYWIDYGIHKDNPQILEGIDMPRNYIAEMVMDRISACEVYQKEKYTQASAYEYFRRGTDKLWFVSENTKHDLEMLLRMVAEKGEPETLRYIRDIYLKGKDNSSKSPLSYKHRRDERKEQG